MKTRQDYIAAQRACGIKPGDRVRITRSASFREQGWADSWVPAMDAYVGTEQTVGAPLLESHGFRLRDYNFPFFILEKVAPAKPAKVAPVKPEKAKRAKLLRTLKLTRYGSHFCLSKKQVFGLCAAAMWQVFAVPTTKRKITLRVYDGPSKGAVMVRRLSAGSGYCYIDGETHFVFNRFREHRFVRAAQLPETIWVKVS